MASYEVHCPACGHVWQSTSFTGKTRCGECRTPVYVSVHERPAHMVDVGRQLRHRYRHGTQKGDARTVSTLHARPARARTVWSDDDAAYDDEEWDDDWDTERDVDNQDAEPDNWNDRVPHGRAARPGGPTTDPRYAPTLLDMLRAARNRQPATPRLPVPWQPVVMPQRPASPLQTRTRAATPVPGRAPHAVLYVSPDQHSPAHTYGPRCPHALALPINVVLPVLARCEACGATERVTGGSQLTLAMVPADAKPATLVRRATKR